MILGNAAAVGFSILVISFFSSEGIFKKKTAERIANTFQRGLLICIAVAFLATSVFTYILQNGIVKIETQEVFTSAMNDVEADVKGKSNSHLLEIAQAVKEDYEKNTEISLFTLAEEYDIKEINVVNDSGWIIDSTELEVINNYDMNSKPQSKEFVDVLKTQNSFVQDYGPRGKDESVWRKYAAIKLTNGGFIQVGYDAEQFHTILNEFVIDFTKNRHVGTSGFVAVLDVTFQLSLEDRLAFKGGRSIVDGIH